jgi:arylformamidase
LGAHTGTHVDAPFHFIADGANLSEFDVSHFYGPCRLIAVSDEVSVVTKAELESYSPAKGEILLIKTRNSSFSEDEPFRKDYVALDISAGEYLAECGVKTIGIDYLSVENPINKSGVHLIILGAGIGIIEGLMLKDVPAGQYFLSALPLRVEGVEGSPVRAVLFDFDR